MNELAAEWVEKAEADWTTAGREFRARKNPNYDDVCFHSQQCAEKYLKALLQKAKIDFSKTHNLILLLDLAREVEPDLEMLRPILQRLNAFAVDFRYPGESADKKTAQSAWSDCKMIRDRIRAILRI